MKRRGSACAVLGILMAITGAPLVAQEVPERRILVRVSPIALIFTNFKFGGEFMVTDQIAADVILNHNRNFFGSGVDISSAMAGARFYPSAAFRGFSVAGHLGGMSFVLDNQNISHPMLNVELAYSWLLGETERFYVAPAFGATRLFATGSIDGDTGEETFNWSASVPVPNARFQVGYRF